MDDFYELAMNSIDRVLNLVRGRSETQLQLNAGQCKVLAQGLAEISIYLHYRSHKLKGRYKGVLQIALLHLYFAIRKAELLVEKCCFKKMEPWLVAAMTLVEIQESFAAIIVDLHQWRLLLDFAIASAVGASHERKKKLLMIVDNEYKKLHRSKDDLQKAALADKRNVLSKLAEVHESDNSVEYLRATHLKSWLTQFKSGTSIEQKLVEFENPLAQLGKGGYGTVFRVEWLGVPCALKMLNVKDEREATALKGLLHPNIIRLHRYWEAPNENPKSNLLMELMALDLGAFIKDRLEDMKKKHSGSMPFSLPVAIDIMLQIAQALRYMHDRHLTHRDLKTANILVRRVSEAFTSFYPEGYLEVKLADFGLAEAYDNTSTSCRPARNTGTALYGAPEIFGKDLVTERNFPPMADVWSFGVTCSEILSGKRPFENVPKATLHTMIVKGNLRPPLPKLCPEYLAFIIRSCWETQPQRRPDFASVCRMLRHAKLLSLGITKLDDSRLFIAYTTRRGFVKSFGGPKTSKVGIKSRLWALVGTSLKLLSITKNLKEVRESRDNCRFEPHERHVEMERLEGPKVLNKTAKRAKSRTGAEIPREKNVEVVTFEEKEQRMNSLTFFSRAAFDLDGIKRASREVLGRGNVGTMFKMNLEDGSFIAVKRLEEFASKTQRIKDFDAWIQPIGNMRHPYVAALRAYYFSKNEKFLVYDYMSMGSLRGLLHGHRDCILMPVGWLTRVRIAITAAHGLLYLHAQGPSFVHGNIKSSNILLNRYKEALISDFGISKRLSFTDSSKAYHAPELNGSRKASQESDVYSFGVLLLELLTGEEPTIGSANGETNNLPHRVKFMIRNSNSQWKLLGRVFDKELVDNVSEYNIEMLPAEEMMALLEVALQCATDNPFWRPKMSDVYPRLVAVQETTKVIVGDVSPGYLSLQEMC